LTLELLGWVATAAFAVSYFARKPAMLRGLQAAAACLWIGYGLTIHAMPVIISNAIVIAAALASLIRSQRPGSEADKIVC
jgi:hypothetical protein